LKEYHAREANLVRLRRQARASGNFFVEPEAKLLFVTRLIGINKMAPKPRKILQLFRLKQLHNGVFLKVNGPVSQMLRLVAPYVAFGHPSLSAVRKLVYKRGYLKVDGSRIPLTDNEMISKKLGHLGIHGAEDIIHEIFTVGPNFKEVNRFLWPFKLNSPRGGFVAKRNGFHEARGGDWGNREQLIDELITKMI
jgi:large subunit ribosomal protein L7e